MKAKELAEILLQYPDKIVVISKGMTFSNVTGYYVDETDEDGYESELLYLETER